MDLAAFRQRFPQFASVPDETVTATAADAECYLSGQGCSCAELQIELMTAHLLALRQAAQAGTGGVTGAVTSATVGKVTVSTTPPPVRSSWDWWLSSTPYGAELLALLRSCAVGGLYVGGRPERAAFRSVGGRFPRGGRAR
ncbi:DUF4054 domain-containing protein [Azotobacter salinestris]|uniref:DUF4054 domain-containing protein n=1 Tax=Azotobacter salinestris TaxID=69964 RepID=UPI001266D5C3|nr:DUF4054 domain-containing protein [Azotobacter salinestris]